MSNIFGVALSGLRAQATRLAVSADNVANARSLGAPTDGSAPQPGAFTPKQVAQTSVAGGGVQATVVPVSPPSVASYEPGAPGADENGLVPRPNVSLEREAVEQIVALRAFQANVRVIEAQDELLGDLLSLKA
jgi:flagellar basal-body rod protein FlgC